MTRGAFLLPLRRALASLRAQTARFGLFGPGPLQLADEHGTMPAMARYSKKSVVVDAVQWFKHGDHPAVLAESPGDAVGYIDTPEGRLRVQPGDWIITGIAGENYPCKPHIFDRLYTPSD